MGEVHDEHFSLYLGNGFKTKQTTMAKKQFDLSDVQVADELQGVELASFNRRSVAYAMDWIIIGMSIQFFPFAVLVVLVFLLIKKKAKTTINKGSFLITNTLSQVDQQLETYEVNEKLRDNFQRYIKTYIHVMLYTVVIASLVVAIAAIVGMFLPKELNTTLHNSEESFWLQPFKGILMEVQIIFGALSGLFYFSFFTWKWKGQTPGKRIMGIKVVKLNGKKISLWGSFERVSGYTASASLLLTGFFQYFWEKNHQTTHDKIVETIVIDVRKSPKMTETPTSTETAGVAV